MDADAFRHLYAYHFSENRKLMDICQSALSYEQFIQPVAYSYGSVRSQVVHLMETEDLWFSELRDVPAPEPFPVADHDDRKLIRARWDQVEQSIRAYLADLTDDRLLGKPIKNNEEDKVLSLWQVLIHVVNHATDHRAQVLRVLHDLGVKTGPQDYIFYVYDHLQVGS